MKIEVYTKEHCPNCETVKRYLDGQGVKYAERDAAAPASRALLRDLGITSAPGVVIRVDSSGVDDVLDSWGGLRPDRLRHWAGRYLALARALPAPGDRGVDGAPGDETMSTGPVWEADLRLATSEVLTRGCEGGPAWRSIREVVASTARLTRAPHLRRARIDIEIAFPGRRRDTRRLMPTARAIVAGLVDAGVVPDDDRRHLTGPLLEAADDPSPRAWGRRTFTFRIAVTDLEPSSTIPATANATETEGETA